jgi:hypothetical protein
MIPGSDRNIYILYLVQNCSGDHPDSDAMCAGREGREMKCRLVKLTTLSIKDIEKIGGCVSPLLTGIHAW